LSIGTIQRIYSCSRARRRTRPGTDDLPIEAAETLFKATPPGRNNRPIVFPLRNSLHHQRMMSSPPVPSTILCAAVLEYFDASLIGLTATPSKQTRFFQQNLVMEYNHEKPWRMA